MTAAAGFDLRVDGPHDGVERARMCLGAVVVNLLTLAPPEPVRNRHAPILQLA